MNKRIGLTASMLLLLLEYVKLKAHRPNVAHYIILYGPIDLIMRMVALK